MNVHIENIFSSRDLLVLLEVKVLGKVLIHIFVWSVQTISGLDSQSKFQMFTLFSARNVGVLRRYSNMAAPYCVVNVHKTVVLIGFINLIYPILTQQSQSHRKTYSCRNFEREWSNSNVHSIKRSTCGNKTKEHRSYLPSIGGHI